MTVALIDDQLLGQVLRAGTPGFLGSDELYTTGYWYVRLCQAVLGVNERTGVLSGPFSELSPELREKAMDAVMGLPADIGLISLRELAPEIARLRQHHQLNILGIEALAAATRLGAGVFLSAPSPRLEGALQQENLTVQVAQISSGGDREPQT